VWHDPTAPLAAFGTARSPREIQRSERLLLSRRRFSGGLVLAVGVALALAGAAPASEPETIPAPQARETQVAGVGIGAKAFDVVVMRPLSAAATVAGLAFFVASVPFVAPSSKVHTAWEIFVAGPGEYTFRRPLGVF
jgi:hypothetical protein